VGQYVERCGGREKQFQILEDSQDRGNSKMRRLSISQRTARFIRFLKEKGGPEKITSKEIEEWFSREKSRKLFQTQKANRDPQPDDECDQDLKESRKGIV
jgi:hypothetical protein